MVNYKDAQIYCINFNGYYYIGSTAQKKLSTRIAQHRANYRLYNNQEKKCSYCNSYKIFELDINPNYTTIEFYECDNKHELGKRERHYIELYKEKYGNKCVNKQIPTRTMKECQSIWYINNKETKDEYNRKYTEKNRDKINERRRINGVDKKYRETNKEDKLKKRREYYNKNKDRINELRRLNRLKNKTTF